jgi:hypothetical protein
MSARARGFIPDWRPRPATCALLDKVQSILLQYAAQLPLTLRQIFYILVGRHAYDKTEQAYERLGEALGKARRARLISMSAIRDDGFTELAPTYWDSADNFMQSCLGMAATVRLDRQLGQPRRLVLWCEAVGMAPQLARIADPFGITVMSSGGFDSLTDKHRVPASWAGQAVTVLHIGDHDPSGISMHTALIEDIIAFGAEYAADIEAVRVAVTLEQAREFGLPTAPPKTTDRRRGFTDSETVQCEALDPATLAGIVEIAIGERLNYALYQARLDEEAEARQDVLARLRRVFDE